VENEAMARSLILVAGVGGPGQPIRWPDIPGLLRNPILHAHGLVRTVPVVPSRPSPGPRGSASVASAQGLGLALESPGVANALPAQAPPGEDADSMAETRNLSAESAAAMFATLEHEGEDEPSSIRPAEVGQLQMSMDGVLSVNVASESVILEVLELVGAGQELQVTDRQGEKRRRTALGLPAPGRSRPLRPLGIEVQVAESAGLVAPVEVSAETPQLDEQSVDQLELTLSDALTAQGIATVDQLAWRRGADGGEEQPRGSGGGRSQGG
jgi:hypothetical protein